MADTNYTSIGVGNRLTSGSTDPLGNRSLNPMIKESEIIRYFVQGQKQAISSGNLKLEYTETSIRLSNNNAQLVGISKQVNKWQRKVLVSNKFADKQIITQALIAAGFIARQKSSHPEFAEYHYYQVPDGYHLHYTEVMQLWRTWWHNKRYQLNVASAPVDILIFSKGNWFPVKDLQPKQGSFILLTARGEISIKAAEYIVWIDSDEQILPIGSEQDTIHETDNYNNRDRSLATPTDLSYGSTSTHKDPIGWVSEPDEYIDLEAYLSTFNTEDSEDIDRIEEIYNIGTLLSGNNILDSVPPPAPKPTKIHTQPPVKSNSDRTPPLPVTPVVSSKLPASKPITTEPILSGSQRQAALKIKAMNVLTTYLQEGDPIVRTEVLKNAQGEEINRKVTKIQRGCPNWAIDQIKQIS
ncbi:MAG: hypothetical protein LH474_08225 [Chamaesiphon sp.]|nr:hypothetical protein [Chamaesiphon sp.]